MKSLCLILVSLFALNAWSLDDNLAGEIDHVDIVNIDGVDRCVVYIWDEHNGYIGLVGAADEDAEYCEANKSEIEGLKEFELNRSDYELIVEAQYISALKKHDWKAFYIFVDLGLMLEIALKK